MFVIALRFTENRNQAARHMAAHKAWVHQGMEDGVFLLVGSLQPNSGGAIVAHNTSLSALMDRVALDPFVVEGVVSAEVLEITPSVTDERLAFLKQDAAA
jgi:uncharacterized protein YciI